MFFASRFGYNSLVYLISVLLVLVVVADVFINHKKASTAAKIAWVVIVTFIPFLGFMAYAIGGRRALDRTEQRTLPESSTSLDLAKQEQAASSGSVVRNHAHTLAHAAQNPIMVKKTTTVLGSMITALAIILGLGAIAVIIMVAIVMYQCSRPGAKCM